jgi:hypothetical protein
MSKTMLISMNERMYVPSRADQLGRNITYVRMYVSTFLPIDSTYLSTYCMAVEIHMYLQQ